RNIDDDPFAVRANRERFGTEILIAYDPTPATWQWQWDSIFKEDARLAWSLRFVHYHNLSTQDAAIAFLEDGATTFAFPASTPKRDLWDIHARVLSRLSTNARIVAHMYGGTKEPVGDDQRKIKWGGGDFRLDLHSVKIETKALWNDYGPYDYHRDFNLTFPLQLFADVAYTLGMPVWWEPQTMVGIAGKYRTLDSNSPRYCPEEIAGPTGEVVCDPLAPGELGVEWEFKTYLHFAI
ncbi:MAG: glycosidase, partial [Gemmatimonadetes bacterium]|nr:glycosidase [Gemmatimonadota bacterium]